ncbi:MAG: FkbM family methyltransferase [Candidatus Omnitrophota bacterium]
MLKEIQKAFKGNQFDKYQYMAQMFDAHKILYEYADFIKGTDILDITIKEGEVYFTFRSADAQIKMVCIPYDVTSVPFTFLDFASYEKAETKVLLNTVRDGDVILDIGANSGWYTLNWLKNFKEIKVFSFEPMPEIYDKLIKNLALNGQETKNAFNFGLANVNEEVDFFFDKERCGASSMVDLRDSGNTVKVKHSVKRLDDVFFTLGVDRLDFIKCDVEGAEKLVFDGGFETIKKYKPVIFSELLRKWSKKFGYHPNDVIKMFRNIGYECYVINGEKIEKFGLVDDDTSYTNYLFFYQSTKKI